MQEHDSRLVTNLDVRPPAKARQSPVYRWMAARYPALLHERAAGQDWSKIRARLIKDGITDSRGQSPSPAVLARTWQRVRLAFDRMPPIEESLVKTKRPDVRQIAPQSQPDQPRRATQNHEPPTSRDRALIPLAPGPMTMPAANPPSPEQVPTATQEDPDAAIKRVLDRMDARYRRKHGFYED